MSAIVAAKAQPPARRALTVPWRMRVLDAAATYLPLLLMGLLGLGTWWLVKNTPLAEPQSAAAPPRHEADYQMSNFVVQRFAADGAMLMQIEGRRMHHYPDTNTLEIDDARIRAIAPDGGVTLVRANRALANADGSEVQLMGAAQVLRDGVGGDVPTEFRSEFLHFIRATERVSSHLPVTVKRGASEFRADAVEYDHLARVIELKGRVRAVFAPPGAAGRASKP